jgi:hypothetical protein
VALSDSPEGREKRIAGNGWHGSDGESTTFGLFEKGEPRIRFIPPQTPSSATGLEKVIRRLDPPPNDRGDLIHRIGSRFQTMTVSDSAQRTRIRNRQNLEQEEVHVANRDRRWTLRL